MDIIRSGAGKHFDPEVAEVFVEMNDAFLDCAKKYAG